MSVSIKRMLWSATTKNLYIATIASALCIYHTVPSSWWIAFAAIGFIGLITLGVDISRSANNPQAGENGVTRAISEVLLFLILVILSWYAVISGKWEYSTSFAVTSLVCGIAGAVLLYLFHRSEITLITGIVTVIAALLGAVNYFLSPEAIVWWSLNGAFVIASVGGTALSFARNPVLDVRNMPVLIILFYASINTLYLYLTY